MTPTITSHCWHPRLVLSSRIRRNFIFGVNTDIGKTVISAGLARSALKIASNNAKKTHKTKITTVHYIKPLQCGGNDEDFVKYHAYTSLFGLSSPRNCKFQSHTLFQWDTATSPHLASRIEDKPVGDKEVVHNFGKLLNESIKNIDENSLYKIFIEMAGGVLSPSSASPQNFELRHARGRSDPSSTSLWGWSTQADLYQIFQFPVILIGDGKLGGISSTISSLESLLIRGYDIHAIIFIDVNNNNNAMTLREYVSRNVSLKCGNGKSLFKDPDKSILNLPSLPSPEQSLENWYQQETVESIFDSLHHTLDNKWNETFQRLHELDSNGKKSLWWPFTQHGSMDDNRTTLIDNASGNYFHVIEPENQEIELTLNEQHIKDPKQIQSHLNVFKCDSKFDSCASWWTQGVGHAESSLTLAAASAGGRYGHVLFPNVIHDPVVSLSEKLLGKKGPGYGWADRVFFSDNGSTAMEVAIKMGMRKFSVNKNIGLSSDSITNIQLQVCSQRYAYHGDTLGVMDVVEPSIFTQGQHPWYKSRGLALDIPTISYRNCKLCVNIPNAIDENTYMFDTVEELMNITKRIKSDLYARYKNGIERKWQDYEEEGKKIKRSLIASVIIEPLLLGAGGMKFVDPLWQRALVDIAKSRFIPVIFDEVASGIYRFGVPSCYKFLGITPDIAAYAKLLTGGLLPMSVTLASEEIFRAFWGEGKKDALLHGHSYTAHPVGCLSALHALEAYENKFFATNNEEQNNKKYQTPNLPLKRSSSSTLTQYFDINQVANLSQYECIQECMALGTILSVTIQPPEESNGSGGYSLTSWTKSIIIGLTQKGVYARPLGNVLYIMVSPLTSKDECTRLTEILQEVIINVYSYNKKQ